MPTFLKHFLLQGTILLLWLLFVILPIANTRVEAQGTCINPVNYKYLSPNPGVSWYPNTTVTVRIDDGWEEPDRNALKDGNLKWNDSNCSGVEFIDFSEKTYTLSEYNQDPPDGFVYWQRIDPQNNGANGGVFMKLDAFNRTIAARIKIMPTLQNAESGTHYIWLGAHEVGHTFNLADCLCANQCSCVGERSVMNGHGSISFNSNVPNACDYLALNPIYCPSPSPSPSPTATPNEEQTCYNNLGFWFNNTCVWSVSPGCEPGQWGFSNPSHTCQYWYTDCQCLTDSPIVIDTEGNGFSLTSAEGGVYFDISGSGAPKKLAWTASGSDDVWLVLDRNGNGVIDNGTEMFGNYTAQPEPPSGETPNGFLALAEYDKPVNGGNNDGVIKQSDSIFKSLKLWKDTNHNGVSEAGELFTLSAQGLKTIQLDYQTKKQVDEFGNGFRYRAKVRDHQDAQLGRWAWDVFLISQP